ncbi:MAG TPA: class I SAM-dependent methyltransferase [Dehalococcoidia bacterium]|nr:class I SAM-dependent methyltransferase [Dehalococcoidia bacterium]
MAVEKSEKAGVKVNFITGDFWKIKFDDGVFDLVSDRGFFHILNPSRREEFAVKVNKLLENRGFYYLRCMSDKSEGESGPYRISKDIIERTFSKYFDTLEITDVPWGGRGMWSYVCLLRKRGRES